MVVTAAPVEPKKDEPRTAGGGATRSRRGGRNRSGGGNGAGNGGKQAGGAKADDSKTPDPQGSPSDPASPVAEAPERSLGPSPDGRSPVAGDKSSTDLPEGNPTS